MTYWNLIVFLGWQAGSMDGGKFEVVNYADVPPGLGMPAPLSQNVLIATRFDIHSGETKL